MIRLHDQAIRSLHWFDDSVGLISKLVSVGFDNRLCVHRLDI